MRILIAGEVSGIVREAFRCKGHQVVSCDLLKTEKSTSPDSWHYQGNVFDIIKNGGFIVQENHGFSYWKEFKPDLMIAHPPCTYLTYAGSRWLYEESGRWSKMLEASEFFKKLLSADIEKKVIENPIPHRHATLPKYSQIIQPWQFGHTENKRTCLWINGLPFLRETNNVKQQMVGMHKKHTDKAHYMAPSKDRGKLRSITYQGIANAMAEQWG